MYPEIQQHALDHDIATELITQLDKTFGLVRIHSGADITILHVVEKQSGVWCGGIQWDWFIGRLIDMGIREHVAEDGATALIQQQTLKIDQRIRKHAYGS